MRSACAVLAIALSAALAPAAAQAKTETDSAGPVKATFSYTANKDRTLFKNLKLVITRNGATVLTTKLAKYKGWGPGGRGETPSVEVRRLNGTGGTEPEVILSLYSGGANCCTSALFYSYRPGTNTYTAVRGNFGRYGFALRNLDRKGPVEILGTDVRFQGAFGLPTVATVSPVRIFQLDRGGVLTDATRGFPKEIRKDLREQRRNYKAFVRAKANTKGVRAAIAADQILLNDADGTADTFRRIDVQYGREFGKRLRSFMGRRGYRLR